MMPTRMALNSLAHVGVAVVFALAARPCIGQDKVPAQGKAAEARKSVPGLGATDDAEKVLLINQHIAEKWKENKLIASARASDFEFIRRASLDIIGRIAKPLEIERFLKDPETTRRALLIERLLKSDEYPHHWANQWTVWLMTRTGANEAGRGIYHEQMRKWLEDQFKKESMSYREMVRDLLTATGKTNENGAVNYILTHLGEPIPADKQRGEDSEGKFTMVPVTSRTTRLFLGVQTQCAQCHPHPFNKEWKQVHFWGINAFFRQIDRKGAPQMNREVVLELVDNPTLNPAGRVFFEERNGRLLTAQAEFLDGARVSSAGSPRRQELAQFVTGSPLFAKAFVNRMWGHFFGRGFTNPIDDFGPENEPSHPELIQELASAFTNYGYDPRRLIRWICNSDAYNLSSTANKSNDKADAEPFFSRMLLKAMTPEQLFESLLVASQTEMFESKENRKRLRDAWMRALTTSFGDDEGNEVTFNGTVVQALMMMNGVELNNAITSKEKGTVPWAMVYKKNTPAILDHLYMTALNRPPTARESTRALAVFRSAPVKNRDAVSFWQDLFWALLNSNEFILNH